jgi:glycosyltransferase involved in cell wall biosynthesis
MFRWERRMCLAAREVVAVSPQDARLMHELFGITSVSHIPTGVDIEYFRRPNSVPPKADLVFLGSMDWMPNVDGMEYFIREILPLIRKSIPTCTVAIVGRAPSATTLALAKRDPGIQVTGTVPDVRPWLWGSKASIVPLRIGGGTRLKIYESMAAGTATVSTTIGAEGLDVSHPDNIRLADEPSSFALQCVELLENEQERERVASQALQMVTSHFSWDVVVEEFEKRLISVQEDERVSRSSTASSASQL